MLEDSAEFDREVRRAVYDRTLETGRPPSIDFVAVTSGLERGEVLASFERLAAGRVLVLQPESREILMANPFSAVPTTFVVDTGEYTCYSPCIWDSMGIAAMLGRDVTIRTSCGDCGLAMKVRIEGGAVHGDGVVHIAVPAKHWWDDIVFN